MSVQAVSKHLKVLEHAGLVTRTRDAQRRPVHLEVEVFDLMTRWIERYRRRAEQRYRRLDDVLRALPDDVDPMPQSRGSPASSTPRRRRSSAPTPTRTSSSSGWRHTGTRSASTTTTAGPVVRTGVLHVGDGAEYGFYGSFHEVRPGQLIVQTFTFEGVPDGVALERLVFEDLGDGRARLTATSLVDSFEGRDAFVASGMEVGVQEMYQRLDELLAA